MVNDCPRVSAQHAHALPAVEFADANHIAGEDVYGYGLEGLSGRILGPAGTSVCLGFR